MSLQIEGYASLWWAPDLGGDVVARGAFAESLVARQAGEIAMLWRHQGGEPAGVWDEIKEDGRGLFVSGRVTAAGPAALVSSGRAEGLSIGFRARRARRDGRLRVLSAVELVEVSLVSTPMLPGARVTRVGGPARGISDGAGSCGTESRRAGARWTVPGRN